MKKVELVSFSYRTHPTPAVDKVYDCRDLPNPHNNRQLKELSGLHPMVRAFMLRHAETHRMISGAIERIKSGQTSIAFGCIGGRHRSVALVELVAESLNGSGYEVEVKHKTFEK